MTCTAARNGAASIRYKHANDINTPISDMAQYSGLRCATTLMAHPIANPPNRMKRITSIENRESLSVIVKAVELISRFDSHDLRVTTYKPQIEVKQRCRQDNIEYCERQ